jgi:RNA polymerase sigma factor (sigma-70 family)
MELSADLGRATGRAPDSSSASNGTCAADSVSQPRSDRDLVTLVRSAQTGNVDAFTQLAVMFAPSAFRFLAVRLRHEADARDALQETLVAAWQALPRLRKPERFLPWFLGIAVNKAKDFARARQREANLPVPPAVASDQFEMFELEDVIGSLPGSLRDVILLRYLLTLSERETAQALGVRVGTVKSRANRARKALEGLLADSGSESSRVGGTS